MPARIENFLDWFLPANIRGDTGLRRRAHSFVWGHLVATPMGYMLLAYVYVSDPEPIGWHWALVAAMSVFLIYLPALKLGVHFEWLLFFAAQYFGLFVLLVVVLFGGVDSPFLPWFGAVVLTGCLYLGDRRGLRNVLIASAIAELIAVYALSACGIRLMPPVPPRLLANIGEASDFFLIAYILSVAFNFVGIVSANRADLQDEIAHRRRTEARLIEAREKAEQAARSKASFLASTSHELRTPLNAIIGFSDVIRSEVFGAINNPRYREYIDDIAASGQHLLRIINDILDLSKMEAGKAVLDREEAVDIGAMIEGVERMIRPQARQAGIALSVAMPLPMHVLGDAQMLRQVLLNLVSNAVKFTPPGGVVAIETRRCDGGVALIVRDSGIGMEKADIDIALMAFGQIDSGMSRRYSGTGLGLPLAKAMVELHQGRLDLESTPGQGTIVTMFLPPQRLLAETLVPLHSDAA